MTTIDTTDTTDTTGRHPVAIGHLVMGLAFLGLTAIWGAVRADLVSDKDIQWLLPLPWVFAGGAGLLAVVLAGRRRPVRAASSPDGAAAPEDHEDEFVQDEVAPLDAPGVENLPE